MTDIEELKLAAEEGDPAAQYLLGKKYLEGKEVRKNYEKASNLLYRAADQDYAEAHNLFGYMHEKGIASTIDLTAAREDYRNGARLGSAEAMYNLARLCECEILPGKDYDEAKMWYAAAEEKGFTPAQGCAQKVENKRKSQWNAQVEEMLDTLYDEAVSLYEEKKFSEAFEKFFTMTGYSDSSAIAQMGLMIQEGNSPMDADYTRSEKKEMAFQCFFDAALQGNADAMFLVAQCYATGEGVEENHVNADFWIGKAAEYGNEEAEDILEQVKNEEQ